MIDQKSDNPSLADDHAQRLDPLSTGACKRVPWDLPVEEWPNLDQEVLLATRSRKACMTCPWQKLTRAAPRGAAQAHPQRERV